MKISDKFSKNLNEIAEIAGIRRISKTSEKIGLPPGTLLHVGEQKVEKTIIRMIDYDQNELREIEVDTIDQCQQYKDSPTVTWIEVYGLHDISIIEQLGKVFEIHPLVLEDILNTGQRPKFEEYENHLYITLKNLLYDEESESIKSEQISIVTGSGFVISFHEINSNLFESVRNRIRNSKLRIRKRDVDYLVYALFDTVVDHYFGVLENLGETLEELDSILLQKPRQEHLQTISNLKKCFIVIRKSVWPLQEIINNILNEEYTLINESTLLYFRDIRDHIHQIIDALETYREAASNAVDAYLSVLSIKMNEIMKVLTIAATIFMPLTFIVGIYGMNFKFMPELEWRWGYFTILGVIFGLMILMVIYFRRKKWL
ncbi:magnesium/cobalt transporter CorA [bacterium]|nr:magnesium/cobalt transporter CorA [bacterium]